MQVDEVSRGQTCLHAGRNRAVFPPDLTHTIPLETCVCEHCFLFIYLFLPVIRQGFLEKLTEVLKC